MSVRAVLGLLKRARCGALRKCNGAGAWDAGHLLPGGCAITSELAKLFAGHMGTCAVILNVLIDKGGSARTNFASASSKPVMRR